MNSGLSTCSAHISFPPPNWNKLKRDDDPKKYFLPTRVSLSAFPFRKNYRRKCLIRTKTEGRCEDEEEDDKEKNDKWIKFENKNHERHSRCASSAKLKRICISFCLIRLEVPHHSIFFSPSLRYQRWIRCRLGRVFSGTSEHMKLFWTLLSRFGPAFGTAFQFDLRNTTSSSSGEPFSSWQRFGGGQGWCVNEILFAIVIPAHSNSKDTTIGIVAQEFTALVSSRSHWEGSVPMTITRAIILLCSRMRPSYPV